jgi:cyclase
MLRKRLLPVLLIHDGAMVKTRKYRSPKYVGDPINSTRIFNELCADELIILDISESYGAKSRQIDFELISRLASECFMPVTYGGKIKSVEEARNLIRIGVEKITINSSALANPHLITEISSELGNSSTVISVDVKLNPVTQKFMVVSNGGRSVTKINAAEWIAECIEKGAGEILLTDVSREGTWEGMRKELITLSGQISDVPVILQGGTASYDEVVEILSLESVSALGIGNLVCYHKRGSGVLVNYPEEGFIENTNKLFEKESAK